MKRIIKEGQRCAPRGSEDEAVKSWPSSPTLELVTTKGRGA